MATSPGFSEGAGDRLPERVQWDPFAVQSGRRRNEGVGLGPGTHAGEWHTRILTGLRWSVLRQILERLRIEALQCACLQRLRVGALDVLARAHVLTQRERCPGPPRNARQNTQRRADTCCP